MFLESTAVLGRIEEAQAILMSGLIVAGVVVFIVHSIRRYFETRQKEQTKREVAAYVAEGGITPIEATMILNAGGNATEQKIADGVAWGMIKPEKAESLLRSLRCESQRSPAAQAPTV